MLPSKNQAATYINFFAQKMSYKMRSKTVVKGELWVKLNFQTQLRHKVSYLRSNFE